MPEQTKPTNQTLTDEQLAEAAGGTDVITAEQRDPTQYNFFEAWPSKWKGFSLDGKGNDVG